jgi:hypothetical protein
MLAACATIESREESTRLGLSLEEAGAPLACEPPDGPLDPDVPTPVDDDELWELDAESIDTTSTSELVAVPSSPSPSPSPWASTLQPLDGLTGPAMPDNCCRPADGFVKKWERFVSCPQTTSGAECRNAKASFRMRASCQGSLCKWKKKAFQKDVACAFTATDLRTDQGTCTNPAPPNVPKDRNVCPGGIEVPRASTVDCKLPNACRFLRGAQGDFCKDWDQKSTSDGFEVTANSCTDDFKRLQECMLALPPESVCSELEGVETKKIARVVEKYRSKCSDCVFAKGDPNGAQNCELPIECKDPMMNECLYGQSLELYVTEIPSEEQHRRETSLVACKVLQGVSNRCLRAIMSRKQCKRFSGEERRELVTEIGLNIAECGDCIEQLGGVIGGDILTEDEVNEEAKRGFPL